MSVAEILRMLQTGLDPLTIFPSFDTPYSKHPHTYVASGREIPTIRDIISQKKAQINDIDTIVERLEAILDQFCERREQAIVSMETHEGFISPVRHLPPEILKEIFLCCLPSEDFVTPSLETAPLLLTRICRSWRDVALGTPRLWCSLLVRPPKQISHCHGWLEKAKTIPLSLNVTMSSYSLNPGWREAALSFLQLHSSRLINLTLDFNNVNGLDLLFENVPMLERLTLVVSTEKLQSAPAISIVQPQPRLRSFTINSSAFTLDTQFFSVFNPGWTNLTHVGIKLHLLVTGSIFTMFLRMCPNLDHLVFSPVVFVEEDVPVSVTHPKLRLLQIYDLSSRGTRLDTLTLPNLRWLNLSSRTPQVPSFENLGLEGKRRRILDITMPYVDLSTAKHLLSLFNPGWTDLTHLRIRFRHSDRVFFDLLELCPNLESVVVSSDPYHEDNSESPPALATYPILHSLTIVNPQGPIHNLFETLTLPSLTHLNISFRIRQDWPHAKFKEFLSRSQCPLETLQLKGTNIPIEEREEFGSLIPTLRRVDIYDSRRTDVLVYSWIR